MFKPYKPDPMIFRLSQGWQRLKPREKFLLGLLGLVVAPLLLWQFVLSPIFGGGANFHQANLVLKSSILNYNLVGNRLREIKSKNQPQPAQLEVNLEKIRNDIGIKESPDIRKDKNLVYGNNWVVKFANMRSDQVVQLVYALENARPVVIIDHMEVSSSLQSKNLVRVNLLLHTE